MELFQWDKHFVTGVLEVDQQHRHLVGIINQFGSLLSENKQESDDIEPLLKELSDYAQYHFQEEQKLMSKIGIDRRFLDLQIKEHQSFIKELISMQAGISADDPEAAQHLLNYFTQWLAYHILGIDQNMARQIKAIQSGASPAEAYEAEEQDKESSTEPLFVALNGLFQQVSSRNKKLSQLNQSLEEKIAERNLRLHAEEAMREALSRADDILTRLMVFQDFVSNALAIENKQSFVEYSLETVIETYEMEAAAFFIAEPEGQLRLTGRFNLDSVGDKVTISTTGIPTDKAGLVGTGYPANPITDVLNLHEGMFCPFKGKDRQLGGLLVTGNTKDGIGIYQAPTEDHLSLFTILCAQIGALWTNLFLEILARYDGLTTLFNQRSFYEELHREFSRSRRKGEKLSLIYLDLDGFKAVNDTLGHQTGDEILKLTADALKSTKRAEDVVARYGGDEFCAILPHTSRDEAKIFSHRLIDNFKKQIGDFKVTMSIGIATTDTQDVKDAESLVKAADAGMYRSKKKEGHAVTVADSE